MKIAGLPLPEGLHVVENNDGTLNVADAQEHVWLTFHPAGQGDPEGWADTIYYLVCDRLEITPVVMGADA